MKKRVSRSLLVSIAFIFVLAMVWSKVRIWININLTLFQAMLLFGGAVFALFLIMDHFINSE